MERRPARVGLSERAQGADPERDSGGELANAGEHGHHADARDEALECRPLDGRVRDGGRDGNGCSGGDDPRRRPVGDVPVLGDGERAEDQPGRPQVLAEQREDSERRERRPRGRLVPLDERIQGQREELPCQRYPAEGPVRQHRVAETPLEHPQHAGREQRLRELQREHRRDRAGRPERSHRGTVEGARAAGGRTR